MGTSATFYSRRPHDIVGPLRSNAGQLAIELAIEVLPLVAKGGIQDRFRDDPIMLEGPLQEVAPLAMELVIQEVL